MAIVTLAPVLDLMAAAPLKQALLAAGPDACIAADAVQRVTTPCLQVLVAAVAGGARIQGPSPALCAAARLLDLDGALKIGDRGIGALGDGACPRPS